MSPRTPVVVNNLETHRHAAAFTQEELASRAGVSRQTIIAIEKGNYTPSVLLALKLAKIFKTPVERLFRIT
ncbi:transcriptional regulator [Candidatus Kaiserbacteria bacterium CG10_big_fil_rev_8_21_14_0_10_56_12]|uniref:Transcriptional regulator n=1 Tax=Candidatus Kaiserbacteria bacterium CG10_big_fil_rev_8_21_14_0_10_56_12 TaxID=1974611 RepID=A0A2H0U942_9BACT|nr:MAG: transcriptional regulator [Candidatus Kaiserbacteria bacterium CG10_big_fil_rev_8_21_14_0_10_56_12]